LNMMTYPGGSSKTFEYDPLMRLRQITAKDPAATPIMNYQYDYDPMDNITDKNTEHGHYSYDYDRLYRLTDAHHPQIPELTDETFTYDSVGNRLSSPDTADPWRYNTNNELTGFDDTEFEYDANGNMTRKTTGIDEATTYVYNTENRLTQVWKGEPGTGTLIARYYYDPFGRRLWKEVNGSRTYYMYADEGLVAEMDASGHVTKTYGWKPGGAWGTDPLFMAEDTDSNAELDYSFYHNDHLGTPQKMTASNGAVVWSAKYGSFGKAHVEPIPTVMNNLRFPGQYFDEETGLHYNWFRYYDPEIARYLRADPIGLEGGINLYDYTEGTPINLFDPRGLAGIGGGAYFVGGAEASITNTKCCEGKEKYNVKVLTVCGGAGIGLSGTLPVGATAGGFSSRSGCPRTRYYFKHENVFLYRSVNVQGDVRGPAAGIDVGIYGISTVWVFCSDTVISKKRIGCCN